MQVPVLADDRRLVELAAEPPHELFPILRRAAALTPLVIPLALLPGLWALRHRALDDLGAEWALRGLDVMTAATLNDVLDPSSVDPTLRFQPPLGAWLLALVMRLGGPRHGLTAVLADYLATAGTVAAVFFLLVRLAGPRVGILGACLIAFHAQCLGLAQTPTPHAVGLLFAVLTIVAFLSHLDEAGGAVSWRLLLGGVALGLCLLAAGPLALAVLIVLSVHVVLLQGERVRARRGTRPERRVVWEGWPALRALIVLALTGFSVGGWWELMMFSLHGRQFLGSWLRGGVVHNHQGRPLEADLGFANFAAGEWLVPQAFLLGFVVVGLWCVGREYLSPASETHRRRAQLLVLWTLAAAVMWLLSLRQSAAIPAMLHRWEAFLLVPLIGLAAWGLEEICSRRAPVPVTACGIAATIGLLVWMVSGSVIDAGIGTLLGVLFGLLTGLGLAFWWTNRIGYEAEQRWLLSVLVGGLFLANLVWGLILVRHDDPDEHRLAAFRERLAMRSDVASTALISRSASPPPLRYLVRSLWPDARLVVAESWEGPLARYFAETPATPDARHVMVQWTRREARILIPPGTGWHVERLAEPVKYRDQQLTAWLIRQ